MLACVVLGLFASACDEPEVLPTPPPQAKPTTPSKKFVEVSAPFVMRAKAALEGYLKGDPQVLEVRITGGEFSLQVLANRSYPAADSKKSIPKGTLVQLDYRELSGKDGHPPIGQIHGPVRVEIKGSGDLEENLFPLSEVRFAAIGRVFPIALLAIDPNDGKIERVVIRRNLPFGKRVRGRIFVKSPRMSGSIDVNEQGTPLKR